MESLLLFVSFIWLGYAGYHLFVARTGWKKIRKMVVCLFSILAIMIILSPLFRAILVTFFSLFIKIVMITALITLAIKIYEEPQSVVAYYKARKWIEGNHDENYGKKDSLYDEEISLAEHTREELEALCKDEKLEFKGRCSRRMMIEALAEKIREKANADLKSAEETESEDGEEPKQE